MLTFFGRHSGAKQPSGEMVQTLQQVRGYWEGLKRGPLLPRRMDIDPRGFAGALEKVFVIERVAKGHARFRLSGMHLHDILGMDARGMPLSSFFEPVARTRLCDELEAVFETPSIMEIWLEAERATGRPALTGRMLVLPLPADDGGPKLALGALVTEGHVGRAPRRFAISGLVREVLAAPKIEAVPPSVQPAAIWPAAIQPVAIRPEMLVINPVQPPPRPPLGRPALRLVVSND
jgi:hypothetical protein